MRKLFLPLIILIFVFTAFAQDALSPEATDALLEREAAEAEAESEPPLVQAYKVNGVDAPLPVQLRTNSNNFTLEITPVIGQALSLHFQKRVDGWTINENIFGYTFNTLALAVDFSTGRGYALSDKASARLQTAITMDHLVNINGVSSLSGLTNVIITDITMVNPEDIDRNYALAKPDPGKAATSNGSVVSAAARGDIEGIRKLIEAGHNINERDNSGDNALFKAIKINDPALADLLIKANINISYANRGQTALHMATAMGQYSVVRSLLAAGANPDARDSGQNTALMYAVQGDNLDITELLLYYGASNNNRNAEGFTALMIAASMGKRDQCDMLLNYAASGLDDAMPYAMRSGDIHIINRLLQQGADVNAADSVGNTLLHNAVYRNDENIARLLLLRGAGVNARNIDGQTALMFAVMMRSKPMIELLMSYQPDVYIKDRAGRTVLDIARSTDWYAVKMLEDGMRKSGGLENQLFERVAAGDYVTARSLLGMGGVWTESENAVTGNTPLFVAVSNNDKDMAYLLLELGANPNKQNKLGNTPLMLAVDTADEKLLEMLLKAGAQPNIQNTKGDTALIIAAKLGRMNVARMLLLADADPNLRNYNGIGPLAVAQGENARDVEQILRSFGAF